MPPPFLGDAVGTQPGDGAGDDLADGGEEGAGRDRGVGSGDVADHRVDVQVGDAARHVGGEFGNGAGHLPAGAAAGGVQGGEAQMIPDTGDDVPVGFEGGEGTGR